jgi:hypothetical protein
MFSHRLHTVDGDDVGRGDLPGQGQGGCEELFFGGGRGFRVLEVVLFEEEDESPFVGMLRVEGA